MALYVLLCGAFVQLCGAGWYIRTMIYGNTKANRVPWFLIALSAFVATGAALYEGARWSVLPGFMSGFGPFCIFLVSFFLPGAYWRSSRFDYICGALSCLGLLLWAVTQAGLIALVLAIAADLLACIPLLSKAWKHPETENAAEFATALFSAVVSLFVVRSWEIAEWGYSAYLIVICTALVFSVERKRLVNILTGWR